MTFDAASIGDEGQLDNSRKTDLADGS